MKSRKNLTRFTYQTTDFQGWRLNLARDGHTFTKYYSDKKFGGVKNALEEADKNLRKLKTFLDKAPKNKQGVIGKRIANKANKMLQR